MTAKTATRKTATLAEEREAAAVQLRAREAAEEAARAETSAERERLAEIDGRTHRQAMEALAAAIEAASDPADLREALAQWEAAAVRSAELVRAYNAQLTALVKQAKNDGVRETPAHGSPSDADLGIGWRGNALLAGGKTRHRLDLALLTEGVTVRICRATGQNSAAIGQAMGANQTPRDLVRDPAAWLGMRR